jgi:hypothetical protein
LNQRGKSVIETEFGDDLIDMLKASERLLSIQKLPQNRKIGSELKYTVPGLGIDA